MTQTDVSKETHSRGADTRERILDAAERLYAENGIAVTSIRQITAEANVNLAAINYHFQTKDQLTTAVMRRLVEPINVRRLQLLDALEDAAGERPVRLDSLVRAFLLPVFEMSDNHPRPLSLARLYGRIHAEPGDFVATTLVPIFAPTVARFRPAFRKTLPKLTDADLGWCIHLTIGAMGHTLTSTSALAILTKGESSMESWPEMLERMVTYCAAGFRAMAHAKKGGD